MGVIKGLLDSRELTINLTLRELRTKYKRSFLGWAWSLINPLATAAIYTLVFSFFLKVQAPPGEPSGLVSFPLFLLCALLPFQFFSNGINTSLGTLIGNSNLIKKAAFPRSILVISTILSLTITLIIELGVICVILLISGNFVIPWIPVAFGLVVIEFIFVVGISLMISAWNVYFRDLQYLVAIALQFLFYLTPVVYPITLVPKESDVFGMTIPLREIYRLNPLVRMVEAFRDVLYDMRFPTLTTVLYLLAWAIGVLVLGFLVFGRLEPRLAEEL